MSDQRVETPQSNLGFAAILGVIAVAGIAASVILLMEFGTTEAWTGVIIGPALFILAVPMLLRQARREQDRRVAAILLIALLVKLVGSVIRYYVTFEVYERADATGYHQWGVRLYEQFRTGDFTHEFNDLYGTNFIRFFTGIVYAVIGPSRLGGFLLFSWLGFIGLFYFYRAFVVALPDGNRRKYALLLFFLPSLLFWPSSIGKESWMMMSLGIAAFGVARILTGRMVLGMGVTGLGLWLAALPRPHVAGLIALALALAFIFRRARSASYLAPVGKAVALAVLSVVAVVLVARTNEFLTEQGVDTSGGVSGTLSSTTERTQRGGSKFAPSILESPARAPIAVVTVLFRPFIFEAHNMQALIAALESSFLLGLCAIRFRWALAALASIRRRPYIAFALVYSGLFVVAFSSLANFGLLARERVQLLPLFLVLFSLPPKDKAVAPPAPAEIADEEARVGS